MNANKAAIILGMALLALFALVVFLLPAKAGTTTFNCQMPATDENIQETIKWMEVRPRSGVVVAGFYDFADKTETGLKVEEVLEVMRAFINAGIHQDRLLFQLSNVVCDFVGTDSPACKDPHDHADTIKAAFGVYLILKEGGL